MRQTHYAQGNADGTYIVPAPRPADAMKATLRNAFVPTRDLDPFADLIAKLDTIGATPHG